VDPAEQSNYPNRPIRLIVPEVVGSAADLLARIIAKGVSDQFGKPIEIENQFGEAAIERAIKATPDGYTLLYSGAGLALLPHIKKLSFDPLKDLTPVARIAISPTLLAVNPALPVRTVSELVDLMKAKPNTLRMSTAGATTPGHFAGAMFIAMADVKPIVVHYDGGGPAIKAVVENDAQWTLAPIAGRLPLVRAGKLRALATGSPTRLSMLPDVPTMAESGYPDFNAVGWGAIFVPNGTPQPIIDMLQSKILTVVNRPEIERQFEEQGNTAASSTQAELAKLLREDTTRLGDLARAIGMRIE
jgi:tripartite-type tricarboxylate transporter receptor subunit TctC